MKHYMYIMALLVGGLTCEINAINVPTERIKTLTSSTYQWGADSLKQAYSSLAHLTRHTPVKNLLPHCITIAKVGGAIALSAWALRTALLFQQKRAILQHLKATKLTLENLKAHQFTSIESIHLIHCHENRHTYAIDLKRDGKIESYQYSLPCILNKSGCNRRHNINDANSMLIISHNQKNIELSHFTHSYINGLITNMICFGNGPAHPNKHLQELFTMIDTMWTATTHKAEGSTVSLSIDRAIAAVDKAIARVSAVNTALCCHNDIRQAIYGRHFLPALFM